MKVIDVSEFQGNVDYEKVKADGVEGVVIRAGYGKGNIDDKFTNNIKNAIAAGLNIGIYWFSYAYTEEMARKEAHYCNDVINPYKEHINLPVFFDWEYDSMKYAKKNGVDAGKTLITAMTKEFCKEITDLGYSAGYYLNLDYSKNYYDEQELTEYKRWFARYVKTEQKDCYLWQNSDKGSVNGISGNVDTNILFGSIEQPKEEPAVEKTPLETPVKDATSESLPYIVGNTYTVDVKSALNVRMGAGTEYKLVGYNNLTPDGKRHAYSNGALMSGTRVTCLEVKVISSDFVWIRIPSGWICAINGNKKYVI